MFNRERRRDLKKTYFEGRVSLCFTSYNAAKLIRDEK